MPTLRDSETVFDLDANNNDSVIVEEPRASITSEPANRKPTRKVQVPLSTDGRIDLDLLGSSQRAKIEKALQLEVESRIKLATPEVKSIVQFNKEYVPTVLDALAMVVRGTLNLTRRFHMHSVPSEFIAFIKYTDEQKDKLKDPTARLIEKYVPAKYLQNQELANFVLAFGTVTQEMLTSAGTNFLLSKGLTIEQVEAIRNGTLKIQQQPVNGVDQESTEVTQ